MEFIVVIVPFYPVRNKVLSRQLMTLCYAHAHMKQKISDDEVGQIIDRPFDEGDWLCWPTLGFLALKLLAEKRQQSQARIGKAWDKHPNKPYWNKCVSTMLPPLAQMAPTTGNNALKLFPEKDIIRDLIRADRGTGVQGRFSWGQSKMPNFRPKATILPRIMLCFGVQSRLHTVIPILSLF